MLVTLSNGQSVNVSQNIEDLSAQAWVAFHKFMESPSAFEYNESVFIALDQQLKNELAVYNLSAEYFEELLEEVKDLTMCA